MQELKRNEKNMIITTHKLKEVMAISDRISVMRKGVMIAPLDIDDSTVQELAQLLVGREMTNGISIPLENKLL
jgi:simple sugar transport system ATP-binding protein